MPSSDELSESLERLTNKLTCTFLIFKDPILCFFTKFCLIKSLCGNVTHFPYREINILNH